MTRHEHLCLRMHLWAVRDELATHAERDTNVRPYVRRAEECLRILDRPHVCDALTCDDEGQERS
jgi:hypothetical protein